MAEEVKKSEPMNEAPPVAKKFRTVRKAMVISHEEFSARMEAIQASIKQIHDLVHAVGGMTLPRLDLPSWFEEVEEEVTGDEKSATAAK